MLQNIKISILKTSMGAVVLFLCLMSHFSYAQQTANHINNWYYGTGSGMSFNGGAPVNIPSSITAYEVTSNYSDGYGNPLFYIGATSLTAYGAGFTVWDASNTTMPNGDVAVDYSSSCGLTAVPVPGNCDQYYIFALSSVSGVDYGFRYSVIDMTLPGNGTIPLPLGDLVSGQKDVLVFSADTLAEKIKVVQQGVTENYWVITRSLNNDLFYSFEVTSAGVNPVPVVSTISATNWPTSTGSPIVSWLAVNKDRNIIAEANGFGPEVNVYDFNNLTGILTLGEVVIPTGTFGSDIPYGVEFSPSGDVLYCNWYEGGNNTYISSFDMTVGFGLIGATRQDYLIAAGAAEYGAMVKAPDGKIYATRASNPQLIVINTPENYLAPTIVSPGYDPSPGVADIGMPNITYYYHPDNFIDTLAGGDRTICANDQATIGAIAYDSIWATYSWEPALMVTDPGNAVTQTVPMTADQQFIVHVITACGDTVNSDTTIVYVFNPITPTIYTPNAWYCVGDNLTPIKTDTGDLWYDDALLTNQVGTSDTLIPPIVVGTTTYYVVDTTAGCYSLADSVNVIFENCTYPCATNIIQNGGFENYANCPTGPSELAEAIGWENIQSSSNDYFNCGYYGHPSQATWPPFSSTTTGMFFNPEGTGYAGFILGGTGFGAEGFGQQVNLSKCVEYTFQFRMAIALVTGALDNNVCIYLGNSNSATPCMTGFTSVACIDRDSINMNWKVFTVTFTPTQDYTYMAIAGACPTVGTNSIGGYAYLDDLYLCANNCANPPIINAALEVTPASCGINDGSATIDMSGCYGIYSFDWQDVLNLGTTVSTDSMPTTLAGATYQVIVTDGNLCSDTSQVVVTQFGAGLDAGVDTTVMLCDDMLPFNLLELLGGNPDSLGVFSPVLNSGSTIFDPIVDGAGVYTYTHLDTCANSSTIIIGTQGCQVCSNNLVQNPSFESIVYCPSGAGQMDAVTDWDKPFTGSAGTGTSDYYNSCGWTTIPANTGNGYAGFFTYVNFIPNAREYVQTQLDSPLQANQCYEVSMFLALEPGSGYAHDSIGMYFSNVAPQSPGGALIPVVPQVATFTAITDTNWVQFTGTFIATGGEQFLTIGVFSQDANLTINSTGMGGIGTKHLVDDVCVRSIQEDTVYTSLIPDTTICASGTFTLTAPSGYPKYTWTDTLGNILAINQQTYTYSPSGNDVFILYALIDSVCPNILHADTIYVTANTPFDANVTTNAPICENQVLSLASTPGGMGFGNYTWVGPNGTMFGQLATINIVPFGGNYIAGGYYVVTITDGICTDTDSVLVVSMPVYDFVDDVDACGNTLFTYPDGTTSTITANESHVSNLASTLGCDSIITTNVTMVAAFFSTSAINVCSGSNYTYADGTVSNAILVNETHTSTLTSINGCDSLVTEDIVVNPTYSNTNVANLCSGQDYTYADGTISTNIVVNESHTSSLFTVFGCDSTITEDIVISGPSTPVAGTNATYCEGDPLIDLTAIAGAGGTLTWYSDAGLTTVIGTGASFTPSNTIGSTSYFVTETSGGCESGATEIIITINPIPSAPTAGTTATYCQGDNFVDLTATAGSGGTLTWYSDAGLSNILATGTTLPINPSQGITTYYVTESVGNCIGPTSSVDITVFPNPTANAGFDVTIYPGETTQLSGSGGVDYLWSPPTNLNCTTCPDPVSSPDNTTMYILTVTDANGCTNSDSVLITMIYEEQDLFVPNVFSPNGDNHNDFFKIEGTGLNDYYIRVFNRWGELVFESDNQSISWDGLQNGKMLNTAVFAYTLTYTNSFGEGQVMSGNVTLIK